MMRHWTTHTIRCRGCGDFVFISREAIDDQRLNDLPGESHDDAWYADGLDYCLRCAGVTDEDEPGSVAGERDGMLHHPVTGASLAAVLGEFVLAAIKEQRTALARRSLPNIQYARWTAELHARHGETEELREFYAAIATSLGEVD